MKKYAFCLTFLFSFFLPSVGRGDVVKLKEGGGVFEGIIVYQTKDELFLDIGKGKLIFKIDEISWERKEFHFKKSLLRRVSVISVPEEDTKDEKGGKDNAKSTSGGSGGSSTTTTGKKKEKVSSVDMGQIHRWVIELRRSRSKYRQRAKGRLRGLAAKYPQTVMEKVLPYLKVRQRPQMLINYCQILSKIKNLDNMDVLLAMMKLLRHANKKVRYYTSKALSGMTGHSVSYPQPSTSLDNSISSGEERAIGQWRTWWNTFQAKKIQEELKQEQKAKSGTVNKDAADLLKRLKKLLKK